MAKHPAGSITRAASGLRTPSKGSVLSDASSFVGSFLKGIEDDRKHEQDQALKEAAQALEERRATELDVRQTAQIAAQQGQTEANKRIAATSEVREARLAQEAEDLETRRARSETTKTAGLKNILHRDFEVSRALLTGLDAGATQELYDQRVAERLDQAETGRTRLLATAQMRVALSDELSGVREEVASLRAGRQAVFESMNDEVARFIAQGVVRDPDTDEAIVATSQQNALQLAAGMSEEKKIRILDLRYVAAGGQPLSVQLGENEANLVDRMTRQGNLETELDNLRVRIGGGGLGGDGDGDGGGGGAPRVGLGNNDLLPSPRDTEFFKTTGTIDHAAGFPEPPPVDPESPGADSFWSLTTENPHRAMTILTRMEAAVTGSDPHNALQDIKARLTLEGSSVQEIKQAGQEAFEADKEQAAELDAAAGVPPGTLGPRAQALSGVRSFIGDVATNLRSAMAAGGPPGEAGDPNSPEAFLEEVSKSADDKVLQSLRSEVTMKDLLRKLEEAEGGDLLTVFQVAKDLLEVGVNRANVLAAIKDEGVRAFVAYKLSNRIGG